jgi:hypothetical protein
LCSCEPHDLPRPAPVGLLPERKVAADAEGLPGDGGDPVEIAALGRRRHGASPDPQIARGKQESAASYGRPASSQVRETPAYHRAEIIPACIALHLR